MPGQAPALTDERELLLAYITQQRDGLRYAAHGLDDEQARLAPSVSALSIGGLIKHVTDVEQTWADLIAQREREHSHEDQEASYEDGFRLRADETLAGVLDRYASVAESTEELVRSIDDLGRPVPVPKGVPWFPDDVEAWTVRWVLLHIIEETARHAGHADIIRESIDGSNAFANQMKMEGSTPEWLAHFEEDN